MLRFSRCRAVDALTPSRKTLQLYVARTFEARLLGLVGLSRPPVAAGLLIPGCRAVHTLGLRFALDVVFLSWPPSGGGARVVALCEDVAPMRFASHRERSRRRTAAVELAAGQADALELSPGAQLELPVSA